MNELELYGFQLAEAARDAGLYVWNDFPLEAPRVAWLDDADIGSFVKVGAELGARIFYLHTEWGEEEGVEAVVGGYAIGGVLHTVMRVSETASEGADPAEDDGISLRVGGIGGWRDAFYDQLPEEVRTLVDNLVDDPRYDPYARESLTVVNEHLGNLDADVYAQARDAARSRFYERHATRLDAEAERLATHVIKLPEFDALASNEEIEQLTQQSLGVTDARVARRAASAAHRICWDSGLIEKARAAEMERAVGIVERLDPLVRDRLVFTSRNNQRDELLADYLADVSMHRRQRLVSAISRVIDQQHAPGCRSRYATAARTMMEQLGVTKAATSRRLGITTSAIDRVMRESPTATPLNPHDPLLELVPELRGRV